MRKRLAVGRVFIYAVLIIGSVVMAFPMAFAISGSLSDLEDFYASPWFPFPTKLYLENYRILFTPEFTAKVEIWRWIANTLVRIAWYTLIPGTVAVLAGYVFARLRFRGRDTAFMYLLSSMMIPGIVFLIPTYIIMARFPGVGGNDWQGQGGHGFLNEWPALLISRRLPG
jgi:multiple sugar transport system permease protein